MEEEKTRRISAFSLLYGEVGKRLAATLIQTQPISMYVECTKWIDRIQISALNGAIEFVAILEVECNHHEMQ